VQWGRCTCLNTVRTNIIDNKVIGHHLVVNHNALHEHNYTDETLIKTLMSMLMLNELSLSELLLICRLLWYLNTLISCLGRKWLDRVVIKIILNYQAF